MIERSKGRISFHPLIKWQKYTEVYIYLSNHRRRKKGRGGGGGGGGGTGGHPPIILEWGQHAFCPPSLQCPCETVKTGTQMYQFNIMCPYSLFECISKSILFNSSLNFATYYQYSM